MFFTEPIMLAELQIGQDYSSTFINGSNEILSPMWYFM